MKQRTVFLWLGGLFLIVMAALLQSCAPGVTPTKGGKSCLDCHPEYKQRYSQGIVHQPVKSGDCAGCHRKHGLIGGAYLKQEEPKLCFRCHQSFARRLVDNPLLHDPVSKGKCSSCHQPHNAPEKNLLNKPGEQLCFECHDQGLFTGTFIHQPLTKGCQACHETHSSKVEKLLIKDESALCQDCHDIKAKKFIQQHGGYPVATGCSDCHNVHAADNPALLKDYTHRPVAAKDCDSCHAAADSAQPFKIADTSAALCYRCHDEQQAAFRSSKTHAPVADGDCFACHSPHASNYIGITKTDPQKLCFECHSFEYIGNSSGKAQSGTVHQPAADGECLSCHGPHLPAAGESTLLRKPGNKLCLDCHEDKAQQQPVPHQPAADGDCLGCHLPHESRYAGLLVKNQRTLCGDCHQVVGEDLGLPNLHRPFVAGECSACHAPHGGKNQDLLRGSGADICGKCHGTIETERKTARHKPFKEGRCELCHVSHGSVLPFLLAKDSKDLCVGCHADRRPPAGTPGGHQNCSVCHHAHGNDEKNYLLKELPELCLSCHNVDRYWANGVGHAPAVAGQCGACHDPHTPQLSPGKMTDADICSGCHAIDAATLTKSHQGVTPGKDSCLSCHDPHGGPDASLTLPVKHAPFADGDCISCHPGGDK